MAKPLEFPAVPLVGEKVKLLQHYHTFVVQCQCDAHYVSVIIGGGAGTPCPACGVRPFAEYEGRVRVGEAVPTTGLVS